MVKIRAIERRRNWKKYNVFKNDEIFLDEITIGYFLDWIEDTQEFEDFLLIHNYNSNYGIKKITHELRRFELTTKSFIFWDFEFVPINDETYEHWIKNK